MNVVHLHIVINIAYGKFSMKVYDVIVQEGILTNLGSLFGKQAVRKFATKAEELAFHNAVEDLSDVMLKQLTRGDISSADKIFNPIQYLPNLQGTKWINNTPEGLAWFKDMAQAAAKDADERFASQVSKLGTKGATTSAGAAEKTAWAQLGNRAAQGLIAYGLFNNVKYVLTDPNVGYFPRMQNASEKLKTGVITQDEFKQVHEKQLRLAAGRLVWEAAPFAFGTVVKALAFIPIGILGWVSKRFAGWLSKRLVNPVASAITTNTAAKYAMYINFLNSDYAKELITTIVLAKTITDSVESSPFIVGTAMAALGVNTIIINVATAVANTTEKLLEIAINEIEDKYGPDIPDALKAAGLSKTPAGSPAPAPAKPTTPSSTVPGPEAPFNSADWNKLPSGYYQNKKTRVMIHPDEYLEKSQ
jgi:hypothetical protein